VFGEVVEVVFELAQRDVPRATDVSLGSFVAFADVDEDQAAGSVFVGGLVDVEGVAAGEA
jgi:hypothetical protein